MYPKILWQSIYQSLLLAGFLGFLTFGAKKVVFYFLFLIVLLPKQPFELIINPIKAFSRLSKSDAKPHECVKWKAQMPQWALNFWVHLATKELCYDRIFPFVVIIPPFLGLWFDWQIRKIQLLVWYLYFIWDCFLAEYVQHCYNKFLCIILA